MFYNVYIQPKKKGRKNIRKLKKKKELSQLTKNALIEEDSRVKRIEERQNLVRRKYLKLIFFPCMKFIYTYILLVQSNV